MISTVTIQRTVTAEVEVDHPDAWTSNQVISAAQFRSADVSERATYWRSQTRTTVESVSLDDRVDPEADMCGPPPEPIALTAEDLA
jgi:hypothetical protein